MSRLIRDWQPGDPKLQRDDSRKTVRRNLWVSIPALILTFTAWQVWSVAVIHLPRIGFDYSPNQLFWLTAVPALSGATFHTLCSLMVSVFGGRHWTAFSTASLLLPAIGLGVTIQNPDISYGTVLLLVLLCGLGDANFPSSMVDISFFFSKAEKSTAVGLNAGLGNLGVSVAQLVVPLVITAGLFGALDGGVQTRTEGGVSKQIWLQNAGFVWVPLTIASSLAAWFGMNDLTSVKASFAEQAMIFKYEHNRVTCFIYLGAFGSSLGFSAGFPLLIQTAFPVTNPVKYASPGPSIGTLTRPLGGWIVDETSSDAKAIQWIFIGMVVVVFGMLSSLPFKAQPGNFWEFFAYSMILFVLSDIGNGSAFTQISTIFLTLHQWRVEQESSDGEQALADAAKEEAAITSFTDTLATYGGFFTPKGHGAPIVPTDSTNGALYGLILPYLCCLLLN